MVKIKGSSFSKSSMIPNQIKRPDIISQDLNQQNNSIEYKIVLLTDYYHKVFLFVDCLSTIDSLIDEDFNFELIFKLIANFFNGLNS